MDLIRRSPTQAAGGRLPDARVAQRSRRRGPGRLAAGQPRGHERIENLSVWLTAVVARVALNMLRARRTRREQPLDTPLWRVGARSRAGFPLKWASRGAGARSSAAIPIRSAQTGK